MSNFNNTTSKKSQKYDDPELEAEVRFAKDNGLEVPTKLAVDIAREQAEKDYKDAIAACKFFIFNYLTFYDTVFML